MGASNDTPKKLCIAGLKGSGKSLFASLFAERKNLVQTEAFSFFKSRAENGCPLEIWDLQGSHPHLWRHHTWDADAMLFVISQQLADELGSNYLRDSLLQL